MLANTAGSSLPQAKEADSSLPQAILKEAPYKAD